MKHLITALCIAACLGGCAIARDTYTPDGRAGHSIDCSGAPLTWGACLEKAGNLCGARGYDVVASNADQSSTMTATQFGLFAGSVMKRSMLIACK